nr:hypothetical protein BaRGS_008568 [Batillaria attramentaria]
MFIHSLDPGWGAEAAEETVGVLCRDRSIISISHMATFQFHCCNCLPLEFLQRNAKDGVIPVGMLTLELVGDQFLHLQRYGQGQREREEWIRVPAPLYCTGHRL